MNVVISRERLILLLKFACNTDLGRKKKLTILCCKPAKSANYASSAFFRKIKVKIILVMMNYAKNYASTIYQSLARIV